VPTFTYRCKWCRHEQDRFHGMRDKPRVRCEKCEHACIKLIVGGHGLVFRGEGFYETDYKRKKGGRG